MLGPVIPLGRDLVSIEPMEVIRVAGQVPEEAPQRPLSILEITFRRPRRRGGEAFELPQPFVQKLPADRQPQQHDEHDRDATTFLGVSHGRLSMTNDEIPNDEGNPNDETHTDEVNPNDK